MLILRVGICNAVRLVSGQEPVVADVGAAAARSAAPVVQLRSLTKRYGGVTVLRDVSLAVRPGEVRALLGENGAGKSTLIKILAGVVPADGGTVTVAGQDVTVSSPQQAVALGIATLHQELAIVPGLSVAENILLGHRVPQRSARSGGRCSRTGRGPSSPMWASPSTSAGTPPASPRCR
jgi:ribose transport system ATP-binding protein